MTEADGSPTVRLGLLRLTDAAPVMLAAADGLFAAEGVTVRLSIEPSWANLADKLAFGLLDAAVMLPPLALGMSGGLRRPGTALIVPMSLSLNGNSVTLSNRLALPLLDGARLPAREAGRRLKALLAQAGRPRLAVVHTLSTHDLLLRYWLDASGIDPDRDVELTVVPPADTVEALAAGSIDGFCAGAPWGAIAARADRGRTVAVSSGIWRNHPEKCLALSADWAAKNPGAAQALVRALLRAAPTCDDPGETPRLAALLARPDLIGQPADAIADSLAGGAADESDRSIFFTHAATFPWRSHALWFLRELARWRGLPEGLDPAALAARVYRPDLYAEAAEAVGISVPLADHKPEGAHAQDWMLPAAPAAIPMLPDLFCDGARSNLLKFWAEQNSGSNRLETSQST